MAETGTAVAKKKNRIQEIFETLVNEGDDFETREKALTVATQLREREMQLGAQKALAAQSWGKNFANDVQLAMAKWCEENGLDHVRHIDILGGTVYLNAEYYIDRLREHKNYHRSYAIVIAPYSRQDIPEDVFKDSKVRGRLAQDEVRDNIKLHTLQRKHRPHAYLNDPKYKDTCAAVVVVIEMWGADAEGKRALVEYEGMNEAGSCGRRTGSNKGKDPVGDAEPVATATTRAYRKACWKVPGMSPKVVADETGIVEMNDYIQRNRTEGSKHNAHIKEIERLLGLKNLDHETREYAQSIYDDWVAGAFENVNVQQLRDLQAELERGMFFETVPETHEVGLDEDEMLDATTGEVIQNEGLCAHCGASIDMGEPHGETCPMVEPNGELVEDAQMIEREGDQ